MAKIERSREQYNVEEKEIRRSRRYTISWFSGYGTTALLPSSSKGKRLVGIAAGFTFPVLARRLFGRDVTPRAP